MDSVPEFVRFSAERLRTERAMLRCFLGLRMLNLVQAAVCVLRRDGGYRRPRLAQALAIATLGESAYLATRTWPTGTYDDASLQWLDTGFGTVALGVMACATSADRRTTSLNWALPLTVTTAVSTRLSSSRSLGMAATSILTGTYAVSVAPSIRRGGHEATTAFANIMSYWGFFLAVGRLVQLLRGYSDQVETAKSEAVEHGQRLAAEAERNRQHRLLHDSALQTLEMVASSWEGTEPVLRGRAAAEAGRLRRALRGVSDDSDELEVALEALAAESAELGVTVELIIAENTPGSGPNVRTIQDATRELIANVAKHSGVRAAVVRATLGNNGLEITVRDHGIGFDGKSQPLGFGLSQSVVARIEEVGGKSEIWSAPGHGTRVTLWVPM